ncbi:TPA: glycosyltransferase [Vibrio parahaemolyticus]|uniref:glycosyltransferase n=2 Tax=Vibrionaceae TaxID=641 RepID=UPI001DEA4AB5|nr:glycosyltransferase [Vibrio parahaemolyticus]EIO2934329.1 glycosyltransferase [Vibrio parahaemolyticus]EJE4224984.1 glycosyltransferase [Vibrio parahaemolyticus]MDF5525323.1 glycosyltransferase [Vibrio parahaemolyticus]MDF5552156.1 glycosyltransferase [Vibrio parahaemolyticus]
MKKNKLLLLLDHSFGGGVEKFVSTIANIESESYEFSVISLFKPEVSLGLKLGVEQDFVFSEERSRLYSNDIKNAAKYIKHHIDSADLVIVSHPKMTKIVSRFNSRNILYVCHGFSKEYYSNSWFKRIRYYIYLNRVYRSKKICCVSSGLRSKLSKIVPFCRTTTIHNPIDIDRVVKKALAYQCNYDNYFVYVGRLSKEKNVEKIIRDFHSSYYESNVKLLLVGEGPEKRNLDSLVKELMLDDRVVFLGYLDNPYPIIKKANALVLASKREGFGYVILEAVILKTPVISVDCDFGPRDILIGSNKVFLKNKNDNLFENIDLSIFSYDEYDLKQISNDYVLERYINEK